MRIFYLPALGYSDTPTHRWLTVRLYERIAGTYTHGAVSGLHVGAWRRMQLSTRENEIHTHHLALLRLTTQPPLGGNLVLVTACPDCGAVQEHIVERGTYAVQCPGCRRIWLTEELLHKGSVEAGLGEIDSKLSAAMTRLAKLQGYTVKVSD